METAGRVYSASLWLLLCLSISASFLTHCGGIREIKEIKHTILEDMMAQLNLAQQLDSSSSSSSTLPPYDSLPPISIPQNTPPICVNPPNTPLPPPSSSSYPALSPPAAPTFSPPNPPEPDLGPPFYEPAPPTYIPTPPSFGGGTGGGGTGGGGTGGGGTGGGGNGGGGNGGGGNGGGGNGGGGTGIPSPTTGSIPTPSSGFLPPIVYPPPTVPPPPSVTGGSAYWCVAKPSVPDPIIQEAMNYACGSGADCNSIQPNGACFKPDTLWAHASFAFNSYWQRTKGSGGSCGFGGTAMLVTVDPSYNGCHFEYF